MWRIHGLTSHKIQSFLHNVCSCAETYLEVGCYLGATAVPAIDGNKLTAYFVDNWEENVQPVREDHPRLPPNSKEDFLKNIQVHQGDNDIKIYDADLYQVDISDFKPIDVFFYDGPHGKNETKAAIKHYAPALSNQAIVIVDDANFDGTVEGAKQALEESGLHIHFERIILEELVENENGWWNGVYILGVGRY